MYKYLFIVCFVVCCLPAKAQPWMPANGERVKLKDIIERHEKEEKREKANKKERERHENGKVEEEGPEYLFDRWAWYQKRHIDQDGYLVSPLATWQEWNKYLAAHKINTGKAQARTTATPANWVFQGPDSCEGGYSGLGRINAVAFHPSDPDIIYAGSSGGGTWRTLDGGQTWAPLYGNLPTLGVSDIVVNHLNPNTIYVCTGDADAGDNYSMGVVKSVDNGVTWNTAGMLWTPTMYRSCRSLVMNQLDTNTLILATNVGIYISHDGGAAWTNVRAGNYRQVLYNPADTAIVYATGDDASGNAQIFRSSNGGVTWVAVTSLASAGRIRLAVTTADPTVVKAIASESSNSGLLGIYGSVNSGLTYTPLYLNDAGCTKNLLGYDLGLPTSACGGQGWYDLCIAIDPTNANKVTIGGVNNYYSADGGLSWQIVTTWYGGLPGVYTVHADKHYLGYNPITGVLYEGCDGGIYKTDDPLLSSWDDITNGMGITQFYRNAVANGVPWSIGGAQDNGTKMINNGTFTDLTGGDGMQCRIDYADPLNTWYTASQYGNLNRTTDGGASYIDISSGIPTSSTGIWITPYIINPVYNYAMLVGIEQLFSSTDQGTTWSSISPTFSASNNIEHIAMCATDPNYIYLTLENNAIRFSPDYGGTWTSIPSSPTSTYISCITVEPKNRNILWVTMGGYGGNRVASYNKLTNAWTPRNGTLPNLPVNCITIDSFSGTRYIGTDVAVFYMDTTMTDWALYNTNLPSVEVTDLCINYTNNELWAATYGRGMWKTVKNEYPTGISIVPYSADVIKVVPNPNRGTFAVTTTKSSLYNQEVTVRLISADGRTLYQDNSRFDSNGSLKVTSRNLPAGIYVCEITNQKNAARTSVVIY